jgi:hypothetical protein
MIPPLAVVNRTKFLFFQLYQEDTFVLFHNDSYSIFFFFDCSFDCSLSWVTRLLFSRFLFEVCLLSFLYSLCTRLSKLIVSGVDYILREWNTRRPRKWKRIERERKWILRTRNEREPSDSRLSLTHSHEWLSSTALHSHDADEKGMKKTIEPWDEKSSLSSIQSNRE